MNQINKMDAAYRKRVRKIRSQVRGNYPEIAIRSGKSVDTVRSVMTFRFRNDSIVDIAESLALELNNRIAKCIV